MLRIVEFEGKKYPRKWGPDFISLSEAMARMSAKEFHTHYEITPETVRVLLTVHANVTDVPEGIEYYDIQAQRLSDYDWRKVPPTFMVHKREVDNWLEHNGRSKCDDADPLAEKKADLVTKEQKLTDLKPIASAAAFALEQAKGDNDEVSNELRTHWSAQEHAYLLAQEEIETAKKALAKCSTSVA